jgi:ASCH domain-containing protein
MGARLLPLRGWATTTSLGPLPMSLILYCPPARGAGEGTPCLAAGSGHIVPSFADFPGRSLASVLFNQELRDDVLAGEITVSFRLWKRPKVKPGGRYPVGPGSGQIEVDSIELVPFAGITDADVRRAGEPDRETLRRRAAHAGPIDDGTLLYRVEFHPVP